MINGKKTEQENTDRKWSKWTQEEWLKKNKKGNNKYKTMTKLDFVSVI